MQKIWLTALDKSEEMVKELTARLQTYGLEVNGHFWQDDLEQAAWAAPREALLDPQVGLWAVLGGAEAWGRVTVRYGLALLAMAVQARRGVAFPVALLQTQAGVPPGESLPTVFKGSQILDCAADNLGAKLIARLHTPASPPPLPEYRLDVYGAPRIGTWFEVGPLGGEWQGAMAGVAGAAEIDFQAVGPQGRLPERSTLNYPLQGMRIELGDKTYTAWAVQNVLDSSTSYFFRVRGAADSMLFCPYPAGDVAEPYVMGF